MLRSMTGFGQASASTDEGSIQVEVKSLNSKFMDLGLRIPPVLSEKEMEIRTLIQDQLERGKISVNVEYKRNTMDRPSQRFNEPVFMRHYAELKKLADRVLASYDTLFELALKSPDVVLEQEEVGKENPKVLEKLIQTIQAAIHHCNDFRQTEGAVLENKLSSYVLEVGKQLDMVEKLDPLRIEKIRSKIKKNVSEFFGEEGFDANRLEQEIELQFVLRCAKKYARKKYCQ